MQYSKLASSSSHGFPSPLENETNHDKKLLPSSSSSSSSRPSSLSTLGNDQSGRFSIETDPEDEFFATIISGNNPNSNDLHTNNGMITSISSFQAVIDSIESIWTTLTFSWIKYLLELGNKRPLEPYDLGELDFKDQSIRIYTKFIESWNNSLNSKSLPWVLAEAFGFPFFMAGLLKLVHDSCLFLGPVLLNRIILFLKDPSQPLSIGLFYVFLLFLSQTLIAFCLRQYFWWCYRVGMRLRSSIVTAVFNKSLVLSSAALTRRSTGEITNLMSVDSTRLQDLTPYLHAIWYSFFQIALALILLWGQVSYASLAGVCVIIAGIPFTRQVSAYLKSIQKQLSKVRDERVKLCNEVFSGIKIIKLQAWERQFQNKIQASRDKELKLLRQYMITQSMASALYSAIPLVVSITTFTAYILMGNKNLDVSTALTSLALFDLLRFPLFMLPNVINNVIEAKISVDRVTSFLIEPERSQIPETITDHSTEDSDDMLNKAVVAMNRATFVWEGSAARKVRVPKPISPISTTTRVYRNLQILYQAIKNAIYSNHQQPALSFSSYSSSSTLNPMARNNNINNSISNNNQNERGMNGHNININVRVRGDTDGNGEYIVVDKSDKDFYEDIVKAQQTESDEIISDLEYRLNWMQSQWLAYSLHADTIQPNNQTNPHHHNSINNDSNSNSNGNSSNKMKSYRKASQMSSSGDRILTLYRINLTALPNQIIAIIGPVGSGKSSLLSGLLGEIRCFFGSVAMRGKVAYVGQRPFIQNATVKDNIIFGQEYDEDKYIRIIEECCLEQDLKVLPTGDMTEIGEKGINISGGQKSRVALARAVYSDAEVYLLDDPLSAVDAHVGQHLFENCILKLRERGACVILVTNSLQYLKAVDHIIVLEDGKVVDSGKYIDLLTESNLNQTSSSDNLLNNFSSTSNNGNNHLMRLPTNIGTHGVFAGLMKSYFDSISETSSMSQSSTIESSVAVAKLTDSNNRLVDIPSTSPSDHCIQITTGTMSESKNSISKVSSIDSITTTATSTNTLSTDSQKGLNFTSSGKLTTIEDREVGQVSKDVYRKWLYAAGGLWVAMVLLIFVCLSESTSVLSGWWLSQFSSAYSSKWFHLGIYALINAALVCTVVSTELFLRLRALTASRRLFQDMLSSVLYSPMSFFDQTPIGRISNRFVKDIYTVDEQLPQTVRSYISSMGRVVSVLLYICVILPIFVIFLIFIFLFYFFAQRYYIKTSRELTRLDSISRSPIYALFSETLDGLTTIRAFAMEGMYRSKIYRFLDTNQRAYFLNFSANCWLGVRLDLVGSLIVFGAALLSVLGRQAIIQQHHSGSNGNEAEDATASPYITQLTMLSSLAGLAISLSLNCTQALNWSVRMSSDLESQMVSVERIKSYSTIEQEPPHYDIFDIEDSRMSMWPMKGAINFINVTLRYREGLPLVLKGLNISIRGSEKIGIVGRTGAGKSSLLVCLMRLVEISSGSILIDNIDISTLPLHTLRSKIAVIPQDPVLFSGSLRSNLDPFGIYTDYQLREGLRRCHLEELIGITSNSDGSENKDGSDLDMKIEENGTNLSVGQRQLLCIARALLTNAKIIIMDEATAAVDVQTDYSIQKTLRQEFSNCTCLTIAHRLNTIMDSDRVLVMSDGLAAEFDSPTKLLEDRGSMFSKLVANWESNNT